MTALIVLAAVVLLIFLALQIKLKVRASYGEDGFSWSVKLGAVRVLPRTKKEKKKAPGKESKAESAAKAEPKKRKLPSAETVRAYAELGVKLLKKLLRSMRLDKLRVHFLSAFDDPYDTAMAYSYAGIAMEAAAGMTAGQPCKPDLHTELDFDSQDMKLDADIRVYARLGKLIDLALTAYFGWRSVRKQLRENSDAKENNDVQSTDR